MNDKKPMRNTEIIRRLYKIKSLIEKDKSKEDIINELQYLIDNI